MESIGNRINRLRNQLGLSVDELAERIGKNRATIYRYEKGDIENLPLSVLEPLSIALETSSAYLMGWEDQPATNIIPLPQTKKIPLLGTIACGDPILAEDNIDGYIEMDDGIKADFALRCKGDSMINARIFDGDIVYIRQQPSVENGEIAAVRIDCEATLKRVYVHENRLVLEPENPTHRPIVLWEDDMNTVEIIGKAVAFTSNIL